MIFLYWRYFKILKYDLLLLNLHREQYNSFPGYNDFLGLYTLAAFLDENGYSARVYVGNLHEGLLNADKQIIDASVKIVGLYCDYDNVTDIISVCQYLRNKYDVRIIVGGPQATALNKDFLCKSKCDVLVRYEGERTMLHLLHHFLDNIGNLYDINGIAFLDNDELIIQPEQALIENLDFLPFINGKYSLNENFRKDIVLLMTGRGCPFNCSFCHEGHHSKKVRLRSIDNVIAEIKYILEEFKTFEYLMIADDTFTLNNQRVREFSQKMQALQKEQTFMWFCEGHVHTLAQNLEMIDYMVEAGLTRLQLGIESGSQKILDKYKKGSTINEIKRVVSACRDKGVLQVYSNIIIGGANFTRDVWEKELEFVKELLTLGAGVLEIGVISFWPLPQTDMTNNPENYGLKIVDYDFYTSTGDFPLAETKEMDVWKINSAVGNLQKEIEKHMEWMLANKKIPHKRILSWFVATAKHNCVQGLWLQILQRNRSMTTFYKLLAKKNYYHWTEMSDEEILMAHPQRLVNLFYELRTNNDDVSFINEIELSYLERELLRFSAGKLTTQEILEKIYYMFSNQYSSYKEYEEQSLLLLKSMGNKYWLLYSKI